ncbi:MAG: hypothetical protein OES47_01440 [Acidobacteriota bacterium]|nr:hypothetical protein [Acidobacteriota bacterium]
MKGLSLPKPWCPTKQNAHSEPWWKSRGPGSLGVILDPSESMGAEEHHREFAHSNNPAFTSAEAALVLPFGRESFLEAAVELYKGKRVELDETTDRIVYQLEAAPVPVTLLFSGMGGPAMANALEMAAGNGAREAVVFGACGGVDPLLGIGELLIAEGGVRGEGASRYYAPIEFPAVCDTGMTESLWRAARTAGFKAHRGLVYTTDAGYRQGPEIYDTYAGLVLGVECECATAAVVARRLGLRLGTVLFCSDNVTLGEDSDRRYQGLAEPRIRAGFEAALSTAIQALTDRRQ